MRAPIHRYSTLAELTDGELRAMVEGEGETLFVEHKANLAGNGFNVGKAMASFANTLGGWVLIGIQDVKPITWDVPKTGAFADQVRDVALEGNVAPLPSFAAAVRQLNGAPVGVIRVYESSDTPHILSSGSIVVREPAKDASASAKGGRYVAGGITSHFELQELARRGERAQREADQRFDFGRLPLLDRELGLPSPEGRIRPSDNPALVLRLAPLTGGRRFRDWAMSREGAKASQEMAATLQGVASSVEQPDHNQSGVSCRGYADKAEGATGWGATRFSRIGVACLDAGGALGLRLELAMRSYEDDDKREFRVDLFEQAFLQPPLIAASSALAEAELFGRFRAHLSALRLAHWVTTGAPGEKQPPAMLPLGPEDVVIPALVAAGAGQAPVPGPELNCVIRSWSTQIGRSFGLAEY